MNKGTGPVGVAVSEHLFAVVAERQIGGGEVSNPAHGWGFGVLNADDIYQPGIRRIHRLLPDLATVEFLEDRIVLTVERANLDRAEVERLVSETGRMWDFRPFAQTVREAAKRRRTLTALSRAYDAVHDGEPLDAVVAQLQGLTA